MANRANRKLHLFLRQSRWLILILIILLILLAIYMSGYWNNNITTQPTTPTETQTACSSNGYNAVYDPSPTFLNNGRSGINLENASRIKKGSISSWDKFLTAVKRTGNQALVDIQGLTCLTNLSILTDDKEKITDISPLAKLVNLKFLYIDHANLKDISPLSHLLKLEDLSIDLEYPVDLTALYGLTELKELYVCGSWVDENCDGTMLGNYNTSTKPHPQEFTDLLKALPELNIRFGSYLNLSF